MLKVKSSATQPMNGSAGVNNAAMSQVTSGPKKAFDIKNPNTGSCPTGTCGSLKELTQSGSGASTSAMGAAGASSALSKLKAGTASKLWATLVCGQEPGASRRDGFNDVNDTALFLRSTNCTLEGLVKLLQIKDGKIGLDKAEMTKRINNTLKSNLGNSDSEMLSTVISKSGGSTKSLMMIGQTRKLVEAAKVKDAQGFVNLLRTATGSNELIEFLDLQAEFAIIGVLLDKAIELGIPQAIDIILNKIQDDKDRRRLLMNSIRSAALNSDLATIKKAVDTFGKEFVIAKVPDIVELILKYYTKPLETDSSTLPSEKTTLIELLDSIDPNWDITTRANESVGKLGPFAVASEHASNLLKMDERTLVKAMIASSYPEMDVVSIASVYHKNIYMY